MEMIVKTFAGLEEALAGELKDLGAERTDVGNRAVQCFGDTRCMYRINLESRLALRVLLPIARFKARNDNQLYKEVRKIDWSEHLQLEDTFAIDAVTGGPLFTHSKYAALKTKDAIVDQFRDHTGKRPSVDTVYPYLRFNLHIQYDRCTLSLDSSGDSLHKRGYRLKSVQAPINEVLAAGMLRLAGWPRPMAFLDPMCGSGTLPIEAATMALRIPPQSPERKFGFHRWRDFDRNTWQSVVSAAEEAILSDWDHPIVGCDRDFMALKASRMNAEEAGLEDVIHFEKKRFEDQAPEGKGLMVMNPPYDERLPETEVEQAYEAYGDKLKQDFTGWEAWIISSHKEAIKRIGLRSSRRLTLFNGPLECKFLKFEMYRGSRKASKNED